MVINSIECHTSKISRFAHHHLQPVVTQISSYIKDANHFFNRVNNFSVPVDSVLVTMDVRLLYTSIPNSEGIAATNKRYNSYIHQTLPTKIITTFVALILTLRNFVFNSKFYLQTKRLCYGYNLCSSICKYRPGWTWTKIYLSVEKKQINFFTLYWRYLYGIDQIWKTAERCNDWTESKTSLYKVWLQIWQQANIVPRHFSLYRSRK